jgi:hypothetical protein
MLFRFGLNSTSLFDIVWDTASQDGTVHLTHIELGAVQSLGILFSTQRVLVLKCQTPWGKEMSPGIRLLIVNHIHLLINFRQRATIDPSENTIIFRPGHDAQIIIIAFHFHLLVREHAVG